MLFRCKFVVRVEDEIKTIFHFSCVSPVTAVAQRSTHTYTLSPLTKLKCERDKMEKGTTKRRMTKMIRTKKRIRMESIRHSMTMLHNTFPFFYCILDLKQNLTYNFI